MTPFMMGFNGLKNTELLRGDSLLFAFRSPGVPGTHFINLERMKAESTLEPLTRMSGNPGSLNWESSIFTKTPLPQPGFKGSRFIP